MNTNTVINRNTNINTYTNMNTQTDRTYERMNSIVSHTPPSMDVFQNSYPFWFSNRLSNLWRHIYHQVFQGAPNPVCMLDLMFFSSFFSFWQTTHVFIYAVLYRSMYIHALLDKPAWLVTQIAWRIWPFWLRLKWRLEASIKKHS